MYFNYITVNVAHASAIHTPVKPFAETRVVVVGGGYAGMNLAQKIKKNCQLTLIDARDSFHHNMGAQRSASEPGNTMDISNLL